VKYSRKSSGTPKPRSCVRRRPAVPARRLVRQHGFKVVLTGEGADEFLIGYDIFKEARVRAFWAREPGSRIRPRLLGRLYGHIPEMAKPSQAYLEAFFGTTTRSGGQRGSVMA